MAIRRDKRKIGIQKYTSFLSAWNSKNFAQRELIVDLSEKAKELYPHGPRSWDNDWLIIHQNVVIKA